MESIAGLVKSRRYSAKRTELSKADSGLHKVVFRTHASSSPCLSMLVPFDGNIKTRPSTAEILLCLPGSSCCYRWMKLLDNESWAIGDGMPSWFCKLVLSTEDKETWSLPIDSPVQTHVLRAGIIRWRHRDMIFHLRRDCVQFRVSARGYRSTKALKHLLWPLKCRYGFAPLHTDVGRQPQ